MKKSKLLLLLASLALNTMLYASVCPDPETSSLSRGVIPYPWVENPFSPNKPDAESGMYFLRANILVAGLGKGVTCTYQSSVGEFSIWWDVMTKIPARNDNNWIDGLGGFVCSQGLEQCVFYTAG